MNRCIRGVMEAWMIMLCIEGQDGSCRSCCRGSSIFGVGKTLDEFCPAKDWIHSRVNSARGQYVNLAAVIKLIAHPSILTEEQG
jgi:hypothetical protein